MKLVLATQNPKKLKEMNEILSHLGVEVVSEAELGVRIEVEETGETFTDNARLKATAVMQATGLPAVADDSGLCVDALNGGPGVYSARFGGEGLDDKGRYTLLLEMLRGQTDRAAHFHTSIVCAFPNGDELVCEGECPGTIAFAPMGEGGFGYDPVFFVPELRKTFGQLTAEEKASVSHRGKALRAFAAALDDYLKGNEKMELTGAQRAPQRAMAKELEPIVHIGKDGIGENLVKQANDALEARELIKCRVLDNSMLTAREACDELSRLTRSEQVQVIGTKFVLYRETHAKPKEKRIALVKDKKKKTV